MTADDGGGPRAGLLNQMTALLYEADPVGLARLLAEKKEESFDVDSTV